MWDIIKELFGLIGALLGFVVIAALLAIVGVLSSLFSWLLGLGDKKKGDE